MSQHTHDRSPTPAFPPRRSPPLSATDGELLYQYYTRQDEPAFREIVRRHLPLIRSVCHDELSKLPEQYRLPIIMHYLECATCEEVANQLDITEATVRGDLCVCQLLRSRLMRRGIGLSLAINLACEACQQAAFAHEPTTVDLGSSDSGWTHSERAHSIANREVQLMRRYTIKRLTLIRNFCFGRAARYGVHLARPVRCAI